MERVRGKSASGETPGQEAGQEGKIELLAPTSVNTTLILDLGAGAG